MTGQAKTSFYVTTPIYYVNDKPHIGHAYTTLACDAMARFKRLDGYRVHFLTGTDEHGQKVQQGAEAEGIDPIQRCDRVAEEFESMLRLLDISNDDYIRTTQERHIKVVAHLLRELHDRG